MKRYTRFSPLPLRSLGENAAKHVIAIRQLTESNLALSLFKAMRDSSSSPSADGLTGSPE